MPKPTLILYLPLERYLCAGKQAHRHVWFSDGGKIPRDRVFLSCSFRRRVSRGELRGGSGWFSIGGLPTRVQPSRSSRHSFLWPQTLPRCQPSHTYLAYLTRPVKTGCYGIGSVLLAWVPNKRRQPHEDPSDVMAKFRLRWTGQSIASLDRRRSARLQHSSVRYLRTRPTSHLSGPSRPSRPSYLEALPLRCGTSSGGRKVFERAHGSARAATLGVAPPSSVMNSRHSITSSARASSVGGTSRPSALGS